MSNGAKDLMTAFGKAANGYSIDDVIDASVNLLANVLRQKHLMLDAALEHADGIEQGIKTLLRDHHYTADRVQRNTVLLNPRQFPEFFDLTKKGQLQ